MDERPELASGTVGTAVHVVDSSDLASSLASEPGEAYPAVLATARMIALMERAAASAMRPLLRPGELSVGAAVDVRHTAPTPEGATAIAEARYVGRDGKLYVFDVVARDPGGEIGRGVHRRAIIDLARLLASAATRRG